MAKGWNYDRIDKEKFGIALIGNGWNDVDQEGAAAEVMIEELNGKVEKACDASMPRKKGYHSKSVYWWSEKIGLLRKNCAKKRRGIKRLRSMGLVDETQKAVEEYRRTRKELRKAIRMAQRKSWEELIASIENDS